MHCYYLLFIEKWYHLCRIAITKNFGRVVKGGGGENFGRVLKGGGKNFGRAAKGGEKFWTCPEGGGEKFWTRREGGAKNFRFDLYFSDH